MCINARARACVYVCVCVCVCVKRTYLTVQLIMEALRAAGKLEELTHEMDRYRRNILGLCEMRWKNSGETTTEEGHKVLFRGKEGKHKHGVGFLGHKDIVNTVMACRPVSSRLITIRLRVVPFNITVGHTYTPKSDCDHNEIKEFYDQLLNVIDQTSKRGVLVVHGDLKAKVGKDAFANWQGMRGLFCNNDINEGGL